MPVATFSSSKLATGQVGHGLKLGFRATHSYSGSIANCRTRLVCNSRSGSGILDAPTVAPYQDKGIETISRRPPIYKVLLHNDNLNRREYVVKILLKVVDGYTVGDAVTAMQEAHETGIAMVIACQQEDAETYCEGLRLNGLTATMEPGC